MKTILRKSLTCIIGIFLFTGISVISWGLDDIPGYFADIHRTIYVVLMAILTILVTIFVPNEGRGSGTGIKTIKRQHSAILYLQILAFLMVILSPISDRHHFLSLPQSSIIREVGLIFVFLGYSLMNWSVMVLGKQFSVDVTIQENHNLITSGPYRFIRHPRYCGNLLFFTGIALTYCSLLSTFIALLTLGVLLWRIFDEEKLMRDTFKEKWDNYAAKSWRLIPFVY